MHIPDGYISPSTSASMTLLAAPFLYKASRVVTAKYRSSTLPLVGVFGAFSFLIMMFNIPLPGGTTGHAVGAVLAALVLGPWVSMISVSLALTIQAIFFGDGGILTLGANIVNIAIAMPLIGYGLFRLAKTLVRSSRYDSLIAGVSGYVAINSAALLTAVTLGVQPLLFRTQTGQPLYFPYSLDIAVPAMMIGHITLAGFAEGIVTAFGYTWILSQFPHLLKHTQANNQTAISYRSLLVVITAAIFCTPIGLLAPGTAWGEWGREELAQLGLGFIPRGFDTWSSFWKAPIPDYDVPLLGNPTLSYVVSGFIGVILMFVIVKILSVLYSNFFQSKGTT